MSELFKKLYMYDVTMNVEKIDAHNLCVTFTRPSHNGKPYIGKYMLSLYEIYHAKGGVHSLLICKLELFVNSTIKLMNKCEGGNEECLML